MKVEGEDGNYYFDYTEGGFSRNVFIMCDYFKYRRSTRISKHSWKTRSNVKIAKEENVQETLNHGKFTKNPQKCASPIHYEGNHGENKQFKFFLTK